MKLYSTAFKNNNTLLDKNYGLNADESFLENNLPIVSFDLSWELQNPKSKYLHFIFIDFDAAEIYDRPWVHWTVANIDLTQYNSLPINAANTDKKLIQGLNSFNQDCDELNINPIYLSRFIGCMPPDKNHTYTLLAYTTENKLRISKQFIFNKLYKLLEENEVIEKVILDLEYVKDEPK